MARDRVHCSTEISAKPDTVWAYLRVFCNPWHPAITSMQAEDGGQIRVFSVQGDDTVYRERLTWFSDSDREMRYIHLQGIEGVHEYTGHLTVAPSEIGGSLVTIGAQIEAGADRIDDITIGTRNIFETGLADLADHSFQNSNYKKAAMPTVPITRRTLGGTPRLAISDTTNKDGPVCLFLHGIGGNRDNWDAQLAQTGRLMRSAALDLRGYGDSALGAEQSSLEDYFADILRVREDIGAETLVLCGLSYGAWIAASFAEAYPELLSGLVLAGGCTGMSEADPKERQAFQDSREKPLAEGRGPADFAPAVINAIAGPNITFAVKQSLLTSMASIPIATYRDALRCFTNPPKPLDLSRLTMPVLMMTGEFDTLASPFEIKSVATRIHSKTPADVRFEVIQGAGHVCNLEDPVAFNKPLLEFLRRLTND